MSLPKARIRIIILLLQWLLNWINFYPLSEINGMLIYSTLIILKINLFTKNLSLGLPYQLTILIYLKFHCYLADAVQRFGLKSFVSLMALKMKVLTWRSPLWRIDFAWILQLIHLYSCQPGPFFIRPIFPFGFGIFLDDHISHLQKVDLTRFEDCSWEIFYPVTTLKIMIPRCFPDDLFTVFLLDPWR